jgi:hypothetical protein
MKTTKPRIRITFMKGDVIKFVGLTTGKQPITCFYDPASKYQDYHFQAFYSKLAI